jgi:Holliday junction resolvase RusA-like endonuclease
MIELKITPVAKPRMTRSDTWKKRPVTNKYWEFKDKLILLCKEQNFVLGDRYGVIFFMPMPTTWSYKKKQEMIGKPHQQKPDLDNILKAVNDCLKPKDQTIYEIEASKIWWEEGKINFYNLRKI